MREKHRGGDIVRFHHLHDDRAPTQVEGPDESGEYLYIVEGKARPMIVLGRIHRIWLETAKPTGEDTGVNDCKFYQAKGRVGYLVLALQNPRSSLPPDVPRLLIRNLAAGYDESIIDLRVQCYPAESEYSEAKYSKLKAVDPRNLKLIHDELCRLKLDYKRHWHRA